MSSEIIHQIVKTIEGEVISRPSPLEFEMAYQQSCGDGPKVEQSGGNRRPKEADPLNGSLWRAQETVQPVEKVGCGGRI